MTGHAASYLQKAERALREAKVLLLEQATEGACNRAYYAMHDAARAALLAGAADNISTNLIKTHRGLIAAFGQRLVQTGKLDAALGRDLNRVQTIRLAADYAFEPPALEDAGTAVDKAERFVAAIAKFIASDPGRDA